MSFNAEDFLTDVSWEKFDELKKPELLALSTYYELGFKQNKRKQVIKNALIDVLVEEELLDEACLDKKKEVQTQFEGDVVKLKELEIKAQIEMEKLKIEEEEKMVKLDIEKKKLDIEQQRLQVDQELKAKENTQKLEMEERLKEKEIEEKYKLEHEKLEKLGDSLSLTHKDFDPAKHIYGWFLSFKRQR